MNKPKEYWVCRYPHSIFEAYARQDNDMMRVIEYSTMKAAQDKIAQFQTKYDIAIEALINIYDHGSFYSGDEAHILRQAFKKCGIE